MTRNRALGNVPSELMVTYYQQRASAGLLIAEGTAPTADGLGYARIPGIYTPAQVAAWGRVTAAVHAAGGKIFLQLMHTGRIFHPLNLPAGAAGVAPSALAAQTRIWTDQQQWQPTATPRALTTAEVAALVQAHAQAARRAREAGFDGVELHGATGYLVEQFLNPHSNQRTDAYGGSVANRARFLLETVAAITDAIGADRVGVRLSPWNTFNDQPHYPEIEETYAYLAQYLSQLHPAYLHVLNLSYLGEAAARTVQTIRRQFTGPLLLNGGMHTLAAIEAAFASGQADLVSIGQPFIANPDLVRRLRDGLPLAPADPATYYAAGAAGFADGYTTYPAAS